MVDAYYWGFSAFIQLAAGFCLAVIYINRNDDSNSLFAKVYKLIMELEIIDILDKSDLNHERVVLKVNEYCNCWPFIIFRNNGIRADSKPFIFPNMNLEKGDIITLYTKNGIERKDRLTNGLKNHILYWGLKNSIWGTDNCVALLIKIEEFNYKTL